MTKFWIILTLLITLSLQCNIISKSNFIDSGTPHLHSGILNLVSKGASQNTFYHNYQQTFTQIPQVAVALCSFSTPLHTNNNDNTFYVLPIPSISKLQVRSRSIKYGWSVMRITFIASTNQELFLDIVSARKTASMQNFGVGLKPNINKM